MTNRAIEWLHLFRVCKHFALLPFVLLLESNLVNLLYYDCCKIRAKIIQADNMNFRKS